MATVSCFVLFFHVMQGSVQKQYSLAIMLLIYISAQLWLLCSCDITLLFYYFFYCAPSRLHDLLAHNDIPPWELVGVFKQVLRDFLRRQEDGMQRRPAPSAPSTILSAPSPPTESNDRNHIVGNASSSLSEESGKHREEIPTISSYVDKHLRAACPYSIHRDWSLPFYHPFAYEAYSTTLWDT